MLNDNNEFVYNKFGIKGYLVYYGQYYMFQPLNIKYEQIPVYYRDYLFSTKSKKVNLEYIDPLNKNKYKNFLMIESIKNSTNKIKNTTKTKNNKIFKNDNIKDYLNFKKKYGEYYKLFSALKNIINENDYNLIVTKIYLNYFNDESLEKLYKKIIKIINENKITNELYGDIFKYLYEKQLFYENKVITGFIINNKKYDYKSKTKKWVFENISNKKELNKTYGLYNFNKKIVFKIGIYDKNEIKKTMKGSISKKSKRTGKVCTSYDSKELSSLLNNLNKEFKLKYKKSDACILLEIILNYYQFKNNNNKLWIVNEL